MTLFLALSVWTCEVYGKKGDPVKWAPTQKVFAKDDDNAICLALQRIPNGARLVKVVEMPTKRRVY